MRFLRFILLLLPASAYYQLTDPDYATNFDSTTAPVTVTFSGTPAYYAPPSNSYSLFFWIRPYELPTGELSLAAFKDASGLIMGTSMQPGGTFRATAKNSNSGTEAVSVTPADGTTLQWLFLAVVACSVSGTSSSLTLAVKTQAALLTSSVTPASTFYYFDPATAYVALGGTATYSVKVTPTQGQFINVQLEFDACRAIPSFNDISYSCNAACSGCSGPGDKSCLDYAQLGDMTKAQTAPGTVRAWAYGDPVLTFMSVQENSYSLTGWFYFTDLSQPKYNLLQTVFFNSGEYHLMAVYLNSAPSFTIAATTDASVNESQDISIGVRFTQAISLNSWYFLGISGSGNQLSFCYATYLTASATCTTIALTGNVLTFGSYTSNWIRIGDANLPQFSGQMGDIRYYYNTAKTTAELNTIFTTRKAVLLTGCTSVYSPFDCSDCTPGYYLYGTVCQRKRISSVLSGVPDLQLKGVELLGVCRRV